MVNPESPYGLERVNEYRNNRPVYEEKIRYFTNKYANMRNSDINREYNDGWDFSYNP